MRLALSELLSLQSYSEIEIGDYFQLPSTKICQTIIRRILLFARHYLPTYGSLFAFVEHLYRYCGQEPSLPDAR